MSDISILHDLGPLEIQKYQQNRFPCFFLLMLLKKPFLVKVLEDLKTLLTMSGFSPLILRTSLLFLVLFLSKR